MFRMASPAATRRGRRLKTLTGMAAGSLWPMGIAPHKKQKFDMPGNVKRWVVLGLLAGWVAGYVTKDGGYGLKRDLILSPPCWR